MPRTAEGWQPIVTRMLENYCITWGGAADLLIPIGDDGALHPAFWRMIEIFDADIWASYVHTVRGWEMADPAAYHEWLEREAKKWARRHGGGIRAARETLRADHILSDVIYQWEPPEQFVDQVRKCSSPVFEHDRLISAAFQADSPPGQYLVNVLELNPLPERLMRLDTSELTRSVQLLLASRYGAFAPSHERALEDAGVPIDVVSTADVELGLLLELAWTGTHDDTHVMLRRALGDHIPDHPLLQAANSLETAAALAVVGCRRMARFYPDADQLPLVVVAGSHVDDFCFVHALERCGVPALWLPADLALGDDPNGRSALDVLGQCLEHSGERIWRRRPKLLTSLSLSSDELTAIRDRLSASAWRLTIDLIVAEEVPLPTHRIPAIRDPENYDNALEEPFLGDVMARGVPVALPTGVRAADPWKLTWWIDVYDPRRTLASRHALSDLVVTETVGWRAIARCGRDGVSYYSHTMGFVAGGTPLEQMVERPRLRFPAAHFVFERLFASAGFTVRESPAGRFRRLATELWGGLEPLAADLTHPARLRLLRTWLSTEPSGTEPGAFASGTRRRYLTFDDAQRASDLAEDELRELLDRYLSRGIIRRGLMLKCENCLQFDWYALDDLGQAFRCRRCLATSTITADTWRGGTEPVAYYDLAEVVYQALSNDFEVPVRALRALSQGTRSFAESPEIEIADPNGKLEIDLLALADGRIIVGEAKRNDKLAKTNGDELEWLGRLRRAAEAASADDVVFATAADSWSQRTKGNVFATFSGPRPVARLIESC